MSGGVFPERQLSEFSNQLARQTYLKLYIEVTGGGFAENALNLAPLAEVRLKFLLFGPVGNPFDENYLGGLVVLRPNLGKLFWRNPISSSGRK